MNSFPNLFIPGAAKSGTSSLHEYLNQHPDIHMSKSKEPHFFCENRSEDEWKSYLDMFDMTCKYNGESSTGYMTFDHVIERMKESLSDVKFIFILRNPINRMISHYNWLYGLGCEDKNILDAFKFDFSEEPKFKVKPKGPGYKNYYHWGLYYKYLKRFYKNFSPEHILVVTTESLKVAPQDTLSKCTDFLGLERHEFDLSIKFNESISVKNKKLFFFLKYFSMNDTALGNIFKILPLGLKNTLRYMKQKSIDSLQKNTEVLNIYSHDDSVREELRKYYADDVLKLKTLINSELSEWKSFT